MNIFARGLAVTIALALASCATQGQLFREAVVTTTYDASGQVSSVSKSKIKLRSRNIEFAYAKASGNATMSYDSIGDEFMIHMNGEHEGDVHIPPETVSAAIDAITSIASPVP